MREKQYEKPMLKRVSLRSNNPVADCWNEASVGGGPLRYYDTEGHGFVKFRITGGGSCKDFAGTTQDVEYTCLLNEQGQYCDQMTDDAANAAENEFIAAFTAAFDTQHGNPNGGSPFHGISDTFPEDPHNFS